MNEKRIKHLELIQAIISRMASNSFLIKGWSVTLVSALFALAAKDSNILFVYLAIFPVVTFWILDGYFLWQERLFRGLYDYVRKLKEDEIDFSMNTSVVKGNVFCWLCTMLSKTLFIFYGILLLSIFVVIKIIAL